MQNQQIVQIPRLRKNSPLLSKSSCSEPKTIFRTFKQLKTQSTFFLNSQIVFSSWLSDSLTEVFHSKFLRQHSRLISFFLLLSNVWNMKKYKLTEKWWSWTGTGKNVGCKQFCNFVMSWKYKCFGKSNKQDFKWTKNELVMLFWLSGTLKSSNWVTFFLVKLASFLKCLQCKHFVYLSKSKKHF